RAKHLSDVSRLQLDEILEQTPISPQPTMRQLSARAVIVSAIIYEVTKTIVTCACALIWTRHIARPRNWDIISRSAQSLRLRGTKVAFIGDFPISALVGFDNFEPPPGATRN